MFKAFIAILTAGVLVALGGLLLDRSLAAREALGATKCEAAHLASGQDAMAKFIQDYQEIAAQYDTDIGDLADDTAPLSPRAASAIAGVPEPSRKPTAAAAR